MGVIDGQVICEQCAFAVTCFTVAVIVDKLSCDEDLINCLKSFVSRYSHETNGGSRSLEHGLKRSVRATERRVQTAVVMAKRGVNEATWTRFVLVAAAVILYCTLQQPHFFFFSMRTHSTWLALGISG